MPDSRLQGRTPNHGGRDAAAGRDHRTCRRPANVVGAEGLCRRGVGARAVLFPARRRTGQRFGPDAASGTPDCSWIFSRPIAKSWPSQWCLYANDLAIQVHGGYGYTRDYDVEQHYRDNRLNPIHEGTNGIQGIDLLGRKVSLDDGAALQVLTSRMLATIRRAQAGEESTARWAKQLHSTWNDVLEVTSRLTGHHDRTVALANSSAYLEAVGHTVIAWMWLEQLIAVGQQRGDFYDGKRTAARYFFTHELPKVTAQLDLLGSMDTTTLDMRPAMVLTAFREPARRRGGGNGLFNGDFA